MDANTFHAISDEELNSINHVILSKYGLDFTGYETTSLKRRIGRIIHKFELESTLGLWQKLLFDKDFILKFKDEISVGLTEMFRNPEIWIKLRDEVLPSYSDKEQINIWHAGCSTGEEIYTMAIVVQDVGLLHKTKSIATDLSDKFIQYSQEGIYELEQVERYSHNFHIYHPHKKFSTYFVKSENTGNIITSLRSYATFRQHNLTIDPAPGMFDIIFCRNVMIYFNETLKIKVLELFYNCLSDDGLLVIGHFDAMPSDYAVYFEYYDSGMKFFKKNKNQFLRNHGTYL